MLSRSIGVKFFVLLILLILMAMAPFCYMVYATFVEFGNHAARESRKQLADSNAEYLGTIAREQAHLYDAIFFQAEISVSLMAAQTKEAFIHLDLPHHHQDFLELGGVTVTSVLPGYHEHGVATAFRLNGQQTARDIEELIAMIPLDPVLKGGQESIRGSVTTYLITAGGVCRYFSQPLDDRGGQVRGRNPMTYPAVKETLEALLHSPPSGQAIRWTRVYGDAERNSPMISVLAPVYDPSGSLQVVAGVDISLVDSMEGYDAPPITRQSDGRAPLLSFLLDQKGDIISFPERYRSHFGLPASDGLHVAGIELSLRASSLEPVRRLADMVQNQGVEPATITLGDEKFVLAPHTLHRLGWHLYVVASQKLHNRLDESAWKAMSNPLKQLGIRFLLLFAIILAVTLVVVYFAVDYFVGPLRRLSEAALRVGRGETGARCTVRCRDELGILADSFNSMIDQLEQARQRQEQEARQLEQTVRERTRDLRNKNIVLRDVIEELNAESERRQQAVEALKVSEKQIRAVMDGSVAGHGIIQDQQIRYVNAMALRIFGYTRKEMVDSKITVRDLVVADQHELVQQMAIENFQQSSERPILLECRRKDGSVFDALVGGAVTTWNGQRAVVATIMDISDQKQIEEELRNSKLLLQESLAEKEVLLREIYHRTKNNMLVIISMLQLQALELDDQQVRQLFTETENRIRAMSLVHEKLYQSQNLTEIDLGQYLCEMVTALVRSMVIDGRVSVKMNCQSLPLSIDNAVPLGLAVNEIVTNSLKHAFPDGRRGVLTVGLAQKDDGTVEVMVADDGIGLPAGLDLGRVRSLGMQITTNLIVKQLRGSLDVVNEAGVTYRMRFAEPVRQKRV